jgi:hypothetical protein
MRARLLSLGVIAALVACATGQEQPDDVSVVQGTAGLDADNDGIATPEDCDDADPSIKPGAKEICNGKDDNCDGKIDEDFDADGDGFATCSTSTKAADCDDKDPAINPGAAEACNNKDDNCDGKVDESFDKDNDGYYACARGQTPADCDDASNAVYPGATEVCDGKDNDCDGKADDIVAVLGGPSSLSNPTMDAHWTAVGAATATGDGWANLTPDAGYLGGALWWRAGNVGGQPASYLFDEFDVTATFWINKNDGADGLAFAWVPGTDYVPGVGGGGYGVQTLGGFAIVIDTFTNAGEAAAPFLVVYDDAQRLLANKGHLTEIPIPEVRDAANHTLRVQLAGGKVTVKVDGTDRLYEYVLPGYVPFNGHWGFTAGTGGLSAVHAVRDITMRFPSQGCVP